MSLWEEFIKDIPLSLRDDPIRSLRSQDIQVFYNWLPGQGNMATTMLNLTTPLYIAKLKQENPLNVFLVCRLD